MSMSKSKVAIGTLLVLGIGVFAGAFGANLYYKHRIEQLFSKGEPPPVVHLFMKRLSEKLDLTDAQTSEIEAIVEQSHRDLRKVRAKYRPRIATIMNKTFAEIEKQLTDEQQGQFKVFREQFRFSHGRKGASGRPPSKSLGPIAPSFLTEVDQKLVLADNQRLKVHEILENHLSQRGDILKRAEEAGQAQTDEIRAALHDLNRQTEARLQVILTEEQLTIYKRIWNEQRQERWDEASGKGPDGAVKK